MKFEPQDKLVINYVHDEGAPTETVYIRLDTVMNILGKYMLAGHGTAFSFAVNVAHEIGQVVEDESERD